MGDRSIRISNRDASGYGGLHGTTLEGTDAPTTSHPEKRTVDGQDVYLSAQDAAQLDAFLSDPDPSRTLSVVKKENLVDEALKAVRAFVDRTIDRARSTAKSVTGQGESPR